LNTGTGACHAGGHEFIGLAWKRMAIQFFRLETRKYTRKSSQLTLPKKIKNLRKSPITVLDTPQFIEVKVFKKMLCCQVHITEIK
jgi:hypothetical protein